MNPALHNGFTELPFSKFLGHQKLLTSRAGIFVHGAEDLKPVMAGVIFSSAKTSYPRRIGSLWNGKVMLTLSGVGGQAFRKVTAVAALESDDQIYGVRTAISN